MRLAIVSDIHGNLPALEAVVADITTAMPDLVINLGDCVSGPLWPKETLQLLQSLNWQTIRGNCDREVGETPRDKLGASDAYAHDRLTEAERHWLGNLPKTHRVSERVFACHGIPSNDDTYLLDQADGKYVVMAARETILERLGSVTTPLVLCGHSHIPHFVQVAEGRFVLNPGSVGLPAHDAKNDEGNIYYSESGSPHAKYAIVTIGPEGFDIELLSVNYNWRAAAAKAAEAKRPDWVQGLTHGRMT